MHRDLTVVSIVVLLGVKGRVVRTPLQVVFKW